MVNSGLTLPTITIGNEKSDERCIKHSRSPGLTTKQIPGPQFTLLYNGYTYRVHATRIALRSFGHVLTWSPSRSGAWLPRSRNVVLPTPARRGHACIINGQAIWFCPVRSLALHGHGPPDCHQRHSATDVSSQFHRVVVLPISESVSRIRTQAHRILHLCRHRCK